MVVFFDGYLVSLAEGIDESGLNGGAAWDEVGEVFGDIEDGVAVVLVPVHGVFAGVGLAEASRGRRTEGHRG